MTEQPKLPRTKEHEQADRQTTMIRGLQYQESYQASLGRMLVRFNELEAMVGEILRVALDKLGKPHLYQAGDYFRSKVDRLELALCSFGNWPKPDFDRLRRVNTWRNELAHGHLHQDPNTGDWQTRAVHKQGHRSDVITPAKIDMWTEEVRTAHGDVGQLLPWVWFSDRPAVLPEGASQVPIE